MPITFFVGKIGLVHVVEPGLTAGRHVAGGRRNTGEFGKFQQSLYIKRFNFLLRLTKVQHHYNSRNAFQVFFRVKSIVKLVFKVLKFMKPYDFLLIPTSKYYRM